MASYELVFRIHNGCGWVGFTWSEGTKWDAEDCKDREVFGSSCWASYGYDAYAELIRRNGGSAIFPEGTDLWEKIEEAAKAVLNMTPRKRAELRGVSLEVYEEVDLVVDGEYEFVCQVAEL